MVFFQFLKGIAKSLSVPVLKSIYKAYSETIKRSGTGPSNGAQDAFGGYFSSIMSKVNLATSPMTESMALKILNI
jgi:hypothetical protein